VGEIPTVAEVAEILVLAPEQLPWAHEGPLRSVIRQRLCLAGWRWKAADEKARRLVARGRREASIRTPRGWDVNTWPGVWPECWICGKPFPSRKPFGAYCSAVCHWRAARIRENPVRIKHCAKCSAVFEASWKSSRHQEYCSRSCQRAVEIARDRESGATAARQARYRHSAAGLAAQERRNAAKREKRRLAKLNGHAKPNGHAAHEDGHGSDASDRPNGAGGPEGPQEDHHGAAPGPPGGPRDDAPRMPARG
jgi:hypothetical protein